MDTVTPDGDKVRQIAPKVTRVRDGEGDTWMRAAPGTWRLDTISNTVVKPTATEVELIAIYGPVEPIEVMTSLGPKTVEAKT